MERLYQKSLNFGILTFLLFCNLFLIISEMVGNLNL